MVFVMGGCQKAQDNKSFFNVTPLIWAIEDQNNESYRGGWTFKKRRKILLFENSQTRGGGLERFGWFPTFYRFLVMKASIIKPYSFESLYLNVMWLR